MEFRILGPLEVRDGERALSLGGAKQRAVLAMLLLDANRVVPVERLIDGVWGDDPPRSALASLQNQLGRLRRELGDRLATRSPGYMLRVAEDERDLDRFQRLVDEARGAEPELAARRLAEALALWRGPPLADLADQPVAGSVAHLDELRLAALEQRVEADLALGRHDLLVPELEELVAREPYRERFRAQLILALYRSGRQADALDAYARARQALVDELGTEPSRELQELQRAVLNRDAALDAPAVVVELPVSRSTTVEQRRTVTVLAADVAPQQLPDDPEARRALLRERSVAAAELLEAHGARVQNAGGGRLLGAFGVPVARDEDVLQAARAAVALRPGARIGLATGEVVTGDPLVSGPPVDEASALRERAAVGEALAGPRTWRLLRHAASGSRHDGVWTVDDVDPDAAPLLRRLETPLVGRERELAQIVEPFERAVAESRPHLVTVYGAPGIGKTRLAIACSERLAPVAGTCVGRCREAARDAPYAPLRDLLVSLADDDELEPWIAARLEPDLAVFLSAAVGGAGEQGRPEETAWAARRLLAGVAAERPLLVVLDDVHWAAPALLDLVESLVELAPAPVLVLCLARPDLLDLRPHWGGGRLSSSSVLLDVLSGGDADALLDLLAADGGLDAGARERMLAVADGNPLFLEQLLAAAVDGESDTIPDSIQTLLEGRLDRLDEHDRAVIQAAAVCGTSFTTEQVAGLVGEDPTGRLLTLVRRELVRPGEADDPGGPGWSFRHGLIRDIAYGSLTKRTRADLHEQLARDGDDLRAGLHLDEAVRARRESGDRGADLDRLADRAAEHLVRAGLAAHDHREFATSASLLGRADALLDRRSRERLEIVPLLASALCSQGRVAAAGDLLAEATTIASELEDAHLVARLKLSGDLTLLWTEASPPTEQILADLEEGVPALEAAGDDESLGWAEMLRFQAGDRAGSLTEQALLSRALDYARRAHARALEDFALDWICISLHRGEVPVDEAIARVDDILAGASSPHVRTSATGALGILRAMRGEFDDARRCVDEVSRALRELGIRQAAAAHSIAVAEVEAMAGDDAAAERILRGGLEEITAIGDEHSTKNIAWRLGLALVHQGRYEEAEPFVAIAEGANRQGFWVDVWWRVVLARIEAARGEVERSRALVGEADDRMRAVRESGMHADALLESAHALRTAGLVGDAETLLHESAAIAERLGYIVAHRRAVEAQRELTA